MGRAGCHSFRNFAQDDARSRFGDVSFEDFLAREVEKKALVISDVGSDGHCFFYSVIRCVAEKCMFKTIPHDLSESMKRAVGFIGEDVVKKFIRSGSYKGAPLDTVPLYTAVYEKMSEIGSSAACMTRVSVGYAKAEEGERAQGDAFADIDDCAYAQAISTLFGVCVAIEYDLGVEANSATRWRVWRPGVAHRDFDFESHANGTTTPMREVSEIQDAICMKLHQSHFQSYVYPNETVRLAQTSFGPRASFADASVARSARYV
jgi:hypothetical protein